MGVDQYNLKNVTDAHDILFGSHWICTGGQKRLTDILGTEKIESGSSILDIGCGKGAAAFELARSCSAYVDGIDLTEDFIEQATESCKRYSLENRVRFYHGDILDFLSDKTYDFILSIDVFLHIHNKMELFNKIGSSLLKPGGRLVFEDYCVGADSHEMRQYGDKFGYNLMSIDHYCEKIKQAGFDVVTTDLTDKFLTYSMEEHEKTKQHNLSFLEDVFRERISRVSKGQHLLVRFQCAHKNEKN